jgi:glutamyl-tRNA synthetase
MHVGHARTFWTAYQRAREAEGVLIFRNEDLDGARSRAEFAQAHLEDLRWLGIRWQEGPDVGGPCQPYRQSQRQSYYLAAWQKLFRDEMIYPCRCSRKDLDLAQQAPHESYAGQEKPHLTLVNDENIYPGTCRHSDLPFYQLPDRSDERPVPGGFNWRFRVPEGEVIEFEDQHFGSQRFVAGVDFGDFLIWRRDDVASYQLANVVDDGTMGITEVVRGADLLKSTARQILLQRALDLPEPAWYHCPLVTDQNGDRIAKRHNALSLRTLRNRGITPMAVLSTALPFDS